MVALSHVESQVLRACKAGPRNRHRLGHLRSVINNLIERGLLERHAPPGGNAANAIALTPKGRAAIEGEA